MHRQDANLLVINHCSPNKGDRAVLVALLRELALSGVRSVTVSCYDRRLWQSHIPGVELAVRFVPWGWNTDPPARRTGIHAMAWRHRKRLQRRIGFPLLRGAIRRGFGCGIEALFCNSEFRDAVSRADLIISTGGHHITTLLERDAVTPQVYDLAYCLLKKKPYILWSQSIGPLSFVDSRNADLIQKIVCGARGVYLRDDGSIGEVRRVCPTKKVQRTYETVFLLQSLFSDSDLTQKRRKCVGISVYATKQRSHEEYEDYVNTMSVAIDRILEHGYRVRIFSMEMKGTTSDDRSLIYDILARVPSGGEVLFDSDEDLDTVSQLKRVAECSAYIGHKTHSVIFALVTQTPIVALAYHGKTVDFMRDYGLDELVITDDQLDTSNITRKVDLVIQDRKKYSEMIRVRNRRIFEELRQTFAGLFCGMHENCEQEDQ